MAQVDDGWRVTIDVDGGVIDAAVGTGEWAVDGPLAASAGARQDGAVRLDVRFLETPHLMHLRLDVAAGTAGSRWATQPLHDGPLTLRRPVG